MFVRAEGSCGIIPEVEESSRDEVAGRSRICRRRFTSLRRCSSNVRFVVDVFTALTYLLNTTLCFKVPGRPAKNLFIRIFVFLHLNPLLSHVKYTPNMAAAWFNSQFNYTLMHLYTELTEEAKCCNCARRV